MNDTQVLGKYLKTVLTVAMVSEEMLEVDGEPFVLELAKPYLHQYANEKVAEVFGDRKTYAIHREPTIHKERRSMDEVDYYAKMETDIYEG